MSRHRVESRTSPRRIQAVFRQRQALELRLGGAPYHSIASALGYATAYGAQLAIEAALKKTLQEPAEDVRKIELERLDALLLAVWGKARKGDYFAIDAALKILARRAKLLGLDAPVKQILTGQDGGPVTLRVLYDDQIVLDSIPYRQLPETAIRSALPTETSVER